MRRRRQDRQAEPAVVISWPPYVSASYQLSPRTSIARPSRTRPRAGSRGLARYRPCAALAPSSNSSRYAKCAGSEPLTTGAVAASAMARFRIQAGPMSNRPAAERSTLRDPAAAHSRSAASSVPRSAARHSPASVSCPSAESTRAWKEGEVGMMAADLARRDRSVRQVDLHGRECLRGMLASEHPPREARWRTISSARS